MGAEQRAVEFSVVAAQMAVVFERTDAGQRRARRKIHDFRHRLGAGAAVLLQVFQDPVVNGIRLHGHPPCGLSARSSA
ncbi:hypothetical protein D3C85_1670860 [compost metagenome]